MFKAISIAAGAAALALALVGCTTSEPMLTLSDAKAKIKEADIPCTSPSEQNLADIMPSEEGDLEGDVIFCSDEGSVFGLGIFDNPSDIGTYLKLVCATATDEAAITQLKEYDMLWGPNWFADAQTNPEFLPELQKTFGGEIADFYSKCPAE